MPPVTKILTELINDGMQLNHYFIDGIMNRLKRRGLLLLKNKCNILVDQAGRFLGVTDDYNLLNENGIIILYLFFRSICFGEKSQFRS